MFLQLSVNTAFKSSKEKVVIFVIDWGSILPKFRFISALEDIFQGVMLPTYHEIFSIGINLESDCTDHINMYYL